MGAVDRFTPVRRNVAQRLRSPRVHLHEYLCVTCGELFLAIPSNMRRSRCTGNCWSCSRVSHGMSGDPRYEVWRQMRARCENPKFEGFRDYGGRGISVCASWQSFEGFMEWDRFDEYLPGLEIDRIDNDGNYEPENCRWTSRQLNSQHTRRTLLDPQKVIKIRSLFRSGGFNQRQIAQLFGVSPRAISGVICGNRWSNISDSDADFTETNDA